VRVSRGRKPWDAVWEKYIGEPMRTSESLEAEGYRSTSTLSALWNVSITTTAYRANKLVKKGDFERTKGGVGTTRVVGWFYRPLVRPADK